MYLCGGGHGHVIPGPSALGGDLAPLEETRGPQELLAVDHLFHTKGETYFLFLSFFFNAMFSCGQSV